MHRSFFNHLDVFTKNHFNQHYISKGKVGHVKGIPSSRVKDRLNIVRESLVECPLVSNLFHETSILTYYKNACTGVFD